MKAIKSLKFKFFGIIGLVVFFCLFSCYGGTQDRLQKNVLVIHSQDQFYSAYLDITQSFMTQMCSPELDCEFDHFEIKIRTHREQFAERFEPYFQKIKEGYYDAIVCIANVASAFINNPQYLDAIPKNVPILYVLVSYKDLPESHLHYHNKYTHHYIETAQLALDLFPNRKNIALLTRAGWEDSEQGREFCDFIESIPGMNVQVYTPDSCTDDELLEKLAENKKDTFVIVHDWPSRNESLYTYIQGLVDLSRRLDQLGIPVFVTRDYLLVEGVMGGVVTYARTVGKDAANWLKEYFKNGANDSYVALAYYRKVLDWNALQRYHVKESNVPSGVMVMNKSFGFWDRNRFRIITGVGIILFGLSLLLAEAVRRLIRNRHHILIKNNILKVTTEKARRAEAAKGRFLSTMSHEIRTPLSIIISLSDLIQLDNTSESEKKDNLTTIHYASESLLKLINNILDLSKLEEGKMKVKVAEVAIRETLNEIDKIFQVKAAEQKIGFHCECRDLPSTIWMDELHVREIIVNLVGNSMKFTTEGKVELDASFRKENAETGTLTVKVKDTGIGISPEFLKNLFTPFNQEERSRQVGTGLGLSISRQLAQIMGGDLTVESEMGKGSTFTLVIPGLKYSEESKAGEQSLNGQIGEEKFDNCRILAVDDMQMNLVVLSKVMKNFGITPLLADTPAKALKLLKENEVDVILNDLRMPEMNGDQLAKEMRKLPNGQKAKIFILTADFYAKDEIDASALDDVLIKPLSLNKIRELLRKWSSKNSD
jgi:signal transduction histidine kinase/CheY-like chemotaxis protein